MISLEIIPGVECVKCRWSRRTGTPQSSCRRRQEDHLLLFFFSCRNWSHYLLAWRWSSPNLLGFRSSQVLNFLNEGACDGRGRFGARAACGRRFGLALELFSYLFGFENLQIWTANPWMDALHKNIYWWRGEIIKRIENLLIARPA